MRLLGSRTRKSASQTGESDPHPLAVLGERENVGQEGFDALVHRVSPPAATTDQDAALRLNDNSGGS
jgi:hypothetical protein